MDDRQAAFVEEMGQYLSSVGMTPMAGRMLAWLLICDPAEQTAAELADMLRASRGAISGAARALETAGFVREWADHGQVNVLGGCCGSTPAHIKAIAATVRGLAPRKLPNPPVVTRLAGLEPFTLAA